MCDCDFEYINDSQTHIQRLRVARYMLWNGDYLSVCLSVCLSQAGVLRKLQQNGAGCRHRGNNLGLAYIVF